MFCTVHFLGLINEQIVLVMFHAGKEYPMKLSYIQDGKCFSVGICLYTPFKGKVPLCNKCYLSSHLLDMNGGDNNNCSGFHNEEITTFAKYILGAICPYISTEKDSWWRSLERTCLCFS